MFCSRTQHSDSASDDTLTSQSTTLLTMPMCSANDTLGINKLFMHFNGMSVAMSIK